MKTSKVTVIMEVEVEDIEAFLTSSELGSIEFSETTGANILKMTVSEGYKIREYKKQIDRKERKLARAKKLLEKWIFFCGHSEKYKSPLQEETEKFLGKTISQIETPEGVEEVKWQRMKSKNN